MMQLRIMPVLLCMHLLACSNGAPRYEILDGDAPAERIAYYRLEGELPDGLTYPPEDALGPTPNDVIRTFCAWAEAIRLETELPADARLVYVRDGAPNADSYVWAQWGDFIDRETTGSFTALLAEENPPVGWYMAEQGMWTWRLNPECSPRPEKFEDILAQCVTVTQTEPQPGDVRVHSTTYRAEVSFLAPQRVGFTGRVISYRRGDALLSREIWLSIIPIYYLTNTEKCEGAPK